VGTFISGSVDLLGVAILIMILSNSIYYIFARDPRFWGMVRAGVLALWLWALLKRTGVILITGSAGTIEDPQVFLLMMVSILGIVTMTVTLLVTRMLSRMYSKYFKRRR